MRTMAALLFGILAVGLSTALAQTSVRQELQSPSAFQSIGDRAQRSRAIFTEIGKLLTHPRWALAPLSMAWQGKSLGDICRQIKDKDRNGGRDLALLQEHIAKDNLVAWGWNPGAGRQPAPGSQDIAGQLTKAWVDSGAECP